MIYKVLKILKQEPNKWFSCTEIGNKLGKGSQSARHSLMKLIEKDFVKEIKKGKWSVYQFNESGYLELEDLE